MRQLFLAMIIALGATLGNTAKAQEWSVELPQGVYATGQQWHYDGYSIIETNRDYLYVNNGGYHHWVTIPPKGVISYNLLPTTRIYSTRPYILNGYGYWYVSCNVGEYLVDANGYWHRQNSYYIYYSNYRYSLRGLRSLSFLSWHLYHHRHHYRGHHHRGHHYYTTYKRSTPSTGRSSSVTRSNSSVTRSSGSRGSSVTRNSTITRSNSSRSSSVTRSSGSRSGGRSR